MTRKVNGGGLPISREVAIWLLESITLPDNYAVMSYEYGQDEGDEPKTWSEVLITDVPTLKEFPQEYINFEIWNTSPSK